MMVVEVGSVFTTYLFIVNCLSGAGQTQLIYEGQIALWLWFTVIFANFAEAMAEGRGKAQAETLRRNRKETTARREISPGKYESVPATVLERGDIVYVEAGGVIPSDGDVIEGVGPQSMKVQSQANPLR